MAGDFPNIDSTAVSQWPESNLANPVTRIWFPAYSITLTAIATLVLAARLCAQARKRPARFGLDDILISIAWVFAILFTVSSVLGTLHFGFDRHIWDNPSYLRSHAALVQWLSEAATTISLGFVRISVLCFYRRLETPCTRAFRRIICIIIALIAGFSIACILTQLLLCRPITEYWSIPEPRSRAQRMCTSQRIYYPVQGSLSSFLTLCAVMIPFYVLRNIPMVRSQRSALYVLLVTALSVAGAGIARTVLLLHLVDSSNGDATWNGFGVFVCGQLECQLAIIFASLPFLYGLISRDPSMPFVLHADHTKDESVISRVSSSLSGQIKRIPFGRSNGPRNLEISRPRPQAVEIPEWEFETLDSPRHAGSPVDVITYEQYARGNFGPPAPPKDSRALFDQYRRERHGEVV